jgi:hypothetical protein
MQFTQIGELKLVNSNWCTQIGEQKAVDISLLLRISLLALKKKRSQRNVQGRKTFTFAKDCWEED